MLANATLNKETETICWVTEIQVEGQEFKHILIYLKVIFPAAKNTVGMQNINFLSFKIWNFHRGCYLLGYNAF
jgi:hypothetical protein